VNWIELAQNGVQWYGVVNAVINPDSLTGGEYLDLQSDFQLLEKDSKDIVGYL
jgi:hypothetical protein